MATMGVAGTGTGTDNGARGAVRRSRIGGRGRYARVGLATTVAATLANVVVYFLGDAFVRYDPDFVILQNVTAIVMFTAIAGIVATLVYAVILRRAANPVRNFGIVSAIVLVVTTIPDLTYIPDVDGASNGQTAVLVATHLVAAAVIVGMLTTLARPKTA